MTTSIRTITLQALLALLAVNSTHAQEPTNAPASAFALVGATVIDGTGAPPLRDAVILVRDGRIACVGSRAACATDGVRVEDVRGRWIMPGIVDAHVHYSQTGWADGRPDALDMRERFPYDATIAQLRDPTPFWRSWLCSGVTATYDVGGYPWTWALRARAEHDAAAPHVAAAGPLLSTRDHWLNTPAERQFIHIGSDSAAERGARYLVTNGTDAIKVWFLAGAESPDAQAFAERMRRAGEIARAAGVPLIVHATGLWQATEAVRAGAQLLVHGVADRHVDDAFLEGARASGTIYTPTLVVTDGYLQLAARNFDDATYGDGMRCVDPATRAKAFLTDSVPGGLNAEQLAQRRARAEQARAIAYENVRRVHAAGIPIAMGTDAGNPLTLHGPSVYLEMEALHAAGLPPMDVIVAATRNGARAMRRERDFGTIEPGRVADLLVLGADPLADIRNVRRVERVIRAGTIHERSALEYR